MLPGDVAQRPAARSWRNLDRSERTNGKDVYKRQRLGLTKNIVFPLPLPPITTTFLFLAYFGCFGRLFMVWLLYTSVKGTKMAVLEVVKPRWIWIRFAPNGIEDISPCSCR